MNTNRSAVFLPASATAWRLQSLNLQPLQRCHPWALPFFPIPSRYGDCSVSFLRTLERSRLSLALSLPVHYFFGTSQPGWPKRYLVRLRSRSSLHRAWTKIPMPRPALWPDPKLPRSSKRWKLRGEFSWEIFASSCLPTGKESKISRIRMRS